MGYTNVFGVGMAGTTHRTLRAAARAAARKPHNAALTDASVDWRPT